MIADGESLGSRPQVKLVFESALRQVLDLTAGERSVILFGEGMDEPKVRACAGFPPDNFWLSAPLSLSVLRKVCQTGEPVEVTDIAESPGLQAELSLVLANVRSLACAPIWSARGKVVGAIYVDWVGRAKSARERILPAIQGVVRKLETFIRSVESGQNAPDPFESVAPPNAPAPAAMDRPRPASRRKRSLARPDVRSRSIFFRSLSTMFGAGLPLVQSLYCLSRTKDLSGPVAEELARRLERGQSLSAAAADLEVFEPLILSTLKVGERSGRLHLALERLAALDEDGHKRRSELRSALVYPAFVLLGCLAFLVLAPAAMLGAQQKMLSDLEVPLPWLTRGILAAYGLFGQWWLWLLVAALAGAWARSAQRRQRVLQGLAEATRRRGPLRSLLHSYDLANWCQLCSLQLQSGLPLSEVLAERPALRQRLMDGAELWQALREEGYPRVLSEMVRCGEESGRLAEMLGWLSDHYNRDLQNRISTFGRLLEPLVMAILGVVAGVLMVATLLPMSRALQNL